jgi:peptidoglycan/LPS O-acetylase OafA/YrhL
MRLLPALYVFVAAMLALGAVLGTESFASAGDALPTLFYVRNLDPHAHVLTPTWSLSVEEQFYIFFPALLVLAYRTRWRFGPGWVLGALAGVLTAVRIAEQAIGASYDRVYAGTESNVGFLLAGAATAAVLASRRPARTRPWLVAVGIPLLLLLGFVPAAHHNFTARNDQTITMIPIAAAALAVVIIVGVSAGPAGVSVPRWMAPHWLVYIGRRSYGLYLWHFPFLYLLPRALPDATLTRPALLVAAWGMTLASWRYVEQPAQRWRIRRSNVLTTATPITSLTGGANACS